jgi:hypothetical protein
MPARWEAPNRKMVEQIVDELFRRFQVGYAT